MDYIWFWMSRIIAELIMVSAVIAIPVGSLGVLIIYDKLKKWRTKK